MLWPMGKEADRRWYIGRRKIKLTLTKSCLKYAITDVRRPSREEASGTGSGILTETLLIHPKVALKFGGPRDRRQAEPAGVD